MKLKEIFYMLGLKPRQKTFGHQIVNLEIAGFGSVEWASWMNPRAQPVPRLEDLDVLRRFIEPGDFVIDIGAHVGDTSLAPALLAGPDGLVLSLEPNPATFQVLKANASLNTGKVNIEAMNVAAMPEDGDYTFQYNDPSMVNGGYQKGISLFKHASFFKVTVRGVNFANCLRTKYAKMLPRLKFLKTDLEGGDHAAFKTLRDIVAEYMPVLQAEVISHGSNDEREAQVEDLRSLGYSVLALRGQTLENLERLTRSHITDGRTFDLLAVPPKYVNLIRPRE